MPAARKLSEQETSTRLAELPHWAVVGAKLHREFRFRDFSEAFAFMTRVAMLAEQRDHHPEWSNVYATVRIDLHTHDAGGNTRLDFELAAAIDRLLEAR
jgi:4a-hydroxytetrahydrobiopterin dehydratase